tara:strand:- start:13 stop:579 length:567 start_codon:yes stop_codon:yes gene_type:complete
MFIQTEVTPNPSTLKFLPGRIVMKQGTAFFQNKDGEVNSPLAKRLFDINGVKGVFLGSDFVTITKSEDSEWQILKPYLLGAIKEHYESGNEVILEIKSDEKVEDTSKDSDIVKQIKELLDTRVRPAVAMDGGDIIYDSFEEGEGIVYLKMQGACSGCPSSTATLKSGIENMLRHYVPEVKEVRSVLEK